MLSVDGVMPSVEIMKNVVTRVHDDDANTMKWVVTVLSEKGSKIIESVGYVPVN